MIKLQNLNKKFNKGKSNEINAISNTSLEFADKGLIALFGKSGCGKTTLLNAVGGLDKVDSGVISFDDLKFEKYNTKLWDNFRNKNIGYIFQNYNLVEGKTVYENLEIVLNLCGENNKIVQRERIEKTLESVGMLNFKNRLVTALSGGQQQRIAIARALVKSPKIIIADEPTGNLDDKNTIAVMDILKKISKQCLVLLVTHEPRLVDYYSDYVLEISNGEVIKNYVNENSKSLDYVDEQTIYLKDLQKIELIEKNLKINLFSDTNEIDDINVNLILNNGILYIKTFGNILKVENLNNFSEIKILDEHRQVRNKDKQVSDKINVLPPIKTSNKGKLYSEGTMLANGFKKLYKSRAKEKIAFVVLVLVTIASSFACAMFGGFSVVDYENNLTFNKSKKLVTTDKIFNTSVINNELKNLNVGYSIYTSHKVLKSDTIFNLSNSRFEQGTMNTSNVFDFSPIAILPQKAKIVVGKLPENANEVAIDKKIVDILVSDGSLYQLGVDLIKDLIGCILSNYETNMKYEVVGIVDGGEYTYWASDVAVWEHFNGINRIYDVQERYNLTQTVNKNEIILPRKLENNFPIGTTRNIKSNDASVDLQLKVIGYNDVDNKEIVSNEDYYEILTMENRTSKIVFSKDKVFKNAVKDSEKLIFESLETWEKNQLERMKEDQAFASSFVLGLMMIVVFAVYFTMRSNMFTKIKEIGVLRAIGCSRKDIIKSLFYEVLAIFTVVIFTFLIISGYIVSKISDIAVFFYYGFDMFLLNFIILAVPTIIFGLLPAIMLLSKTPSQILAKYDI